MRELRRAASGEVTLPDLRLQALYDLLSFHRYEDPVAMPDGAPWSEVLGLLAAQLATRDGLASYSVLTAQVQAESLNREGSRDEALAVLEQALERHAGAHYTEYLQLDLGMLLRDEHRFGRSLAVLRAAEDQIAALRRQDLDAAYTANLQVFEALVASELASTEEHLGMTDAAEAAFERAEALASALDEASGPAVFGGNLVYRLNFALKRERWTEVRSLRTAFEEHPWRELVPAATVRQIRERCAIAEVKAASRGAAPAGAGEDELRALARELSPEEALRASIFLAQSLLDRGALDTAGAELESAWARLGALQGQEPRRLHLLGLRARLLLARGARGNGLEPLLAELRSAFEAFLASAHVGPLEEAGVSLLFNDWVREALGALFELEAAVDEDDAGEERAFGWLARLHAAGTFAREQEIPPPTLAELRTSLLRPGRGLLAFVPGRTSSYAFALDGEGLDILDLPPAWVLDGEARRLEEALQAAITAPNEHADARLAAALSSASEAFVPPGARDLLAGWNSVEIIGLEDFGYVPFEALTPPGGEPFGRTHEVLYQPSLPVGVWLARRAAASPAAVGPALLYLGEGDPAAGGRPELAPLRVDPARLDGRVFGEEGARWRVAGPGDASGLQAALATSGLAVFVVHGLYDVDRVRPAGLLIEPEQPGGGWFAESLESLSCPPAAVVAACGTNRAPLRRGDDGRGHLRAAFFRAGTGCVAAATLPLELESTLDLLADVNARLAAGDSMAGAFYAARRAAHPEARGVHPAHAYLLHVFGAGDVRPMAPSEASAQAPPARSWGLSWLLLAGAGAAAVLFLARAALRAR